MHLSFLLLLSGFCAHHARSQGGSSGNRDFDCGSGGGTCSGYTCNSSGSDNECRFLCNDNDCYELVVNAVADQTLTVVCVNNQNNGNEDITCDDLQIVGADNMVETTTTLRCSTGDFDNTDHCSDVVICDGVNVDLQVFCVADTTCDSLSITGGDGTSITLVCSGASSCSNTKIIAANSVYVNVTCTGELSCKDLIVTGSLATNGVQVTCGASDDDTGCQSEGIITINGDGASALNYTCYGSACQTPLYIDGTESSSVTVETFGDNSNLIGGSIFCPTDSVADFACQFFGDTDNIEHQIDIFAVEGLSRDFALNCDAVNCLDGESMVLYCTEDFDTDSSYCTLEYDETQGVAICIDPQGEKNCQTFTLGGLNTTFVPTQLPSLPSESPSFLPTSYPSGVPSNLPTSEPSDFPSLSPTKYPTLGPSLLPSNEPSIYPTNGPSTEPTSRPSVMPTRTLPPSDIPSESPSETPSNSPSDVPTPQSEGEGSNVTESDDDEQDAGITAMIVIVCVIFLCILGCCVYICIVSKRDTYSDESEYPTFKSKFQAAAGDTSRRVKFYFATKTGSGGPSSKPVAATSNSTGNEVVISASSKNKNNYKHANQKQVQMTSGHSGHVAAPSATVTTVTTANVVSPMPPLPASMQTTTSYPAQTDGNVGTNNGINGGLAYGAGPAEENLYSAEEEDDMKQEEYVTPGGPDMDDIDLEESDDNNIVHNNEMNDINDVHVSNVHSMDQLKYSQGNMSGSAISPEELETLRQADEDARLQMARKAEEDARYALQLSQEEIFKSIQQKHGR